jgi:hypothetical protein
MIFIFRNSRKSFAVLVGVGTVILLWISFELKNTQSPIPITFFQYLRWNYFYFNKEVPFINEYALLTSVVICFLVTYLVYIFQLGKSRPLNISIFGIGLFMGQWIFNEYLNQLSLNIFLFVCIMLYLGHIVDKKGEPHNSFLIKKESFMIYCFPISIIIIVTSNMLPSIGKPLKWQWIDMRLNNLINFISGEKLIDSYDYFSLTVTGFSSSESKLGGNVKSNKTVVMKVLAPVGIYLKGSSKDFYTGISWKSTDDSKIKMDNKFLDFSPSEISRTIFRMSTQSNYFNDISSMETVKVRFENISTKSLFYPLNIKTIQVVNDPISYVFFDKNENISLNRALTKGAEYSIDIYKLDYKKADIVSMLNKCRKGLYGEITADELNNYIGKVDNVSVILYNPLKKLLEANKAIADQSNTLYIKSWMDQYNSYISAFNSYVQKYTQLPPKLPERVRDLAKRISKDKNSDYQKVKAIEEYLSNNYEYTLAPGNIPEGMDFVDHFLFTQKRGYCSYYATAMTVMVRSLGIPARYIEGYVLPMEKEEDGSFSVTNEQGHAWVEVYFEGFGWVPFEPTTKYQSYYTSKEEMKSFMDGGYDDTTEKTGKSSNNTGKGINGKALEKLKNRLDNSVFKKISIIIIIFIIGIFLFMLAIIFRFNYKMKKLMSKNDRENIIKMYLVYMKLLSMQEMNIKPGETPYRYSERIDNELTLEEHNSFRAITDVFVIARYSRNSVSNDEFDKFVSYKDFILKKTKENIGILGYYKCLIAIGNSKLQSI